MEVFIVKDAAEGAWFVAQKVIQLLVGRPQVILGLATGETQKPVYEQLVQSYLKKTISFAEVTTFNLDEYVGLPSDHPSSYRSFMEAHLFSHVDLPPLQRHGLNGMAIDLLAESERYENLLKSKGPIDLQLLGLGRNAHIGFNEPGSSFESRTRVEFLAKSTRLDNQKHFANPEEMPTRVLTVGVGNILEAQQIILAAYGKNKARAVVQMIEGPRTEEVPASALQGHPNLVVVVDQSAAHELKKRELYRLC